MNFNYRENLKYVSYFMAKFIRDKKKRGYAFFKILQLQINLNADIYQLT